MAKLGPKTPFNGATGASEIDEIKIDFNINSKLKMSGALWMWLPLVWLQLEVVRGPVGAVWGRLRAVFGPFGPQAGPKSTPSDPDRTSDTHKLQPHEL